jgi:hypothetical protein
MQVELTPAIRTVLDDLVGPDKEFGFDGDPDNDEGRLFILLCLTLDAYAKLAGYRPTGGAFEGLPYDGSHLEEVFDVLVGSLDDGGITPNPFLQRDPCHDDGSLASEHID